MKISALTNPLSKGESWEKRDLREIEICTSSDNRGGSKPYVYFGISKETGKRKTVKITEDFLLTTEAAIAIGKAIIKQAKKIDKEFAEQKEAMSKVVKKNYLRKGEPKNVKCRISDTTCKIKPENKFKIIKTIKNK